MELTRANYHSTEARQEYMGVSQFKDFCKCEAHALAVVKGEWQDPTTDTLLVGSYIDEYFNGTLAEFKAEHPEMFNSRTGELKAPFKKAEEIIARIERDPFMKRKLGGKRQVIMTGVIDGVKWKIMIDSLHRGVTVDGKVMKDCEDVYVPGEGYKPFWSAYGYDIQGYVYQTIRAQNEGVKKPFELAVATKEDEPDLRVFRFTESTLNGAMYRVLEYTRRFDDIKKGLIEPTRCEHCAYCRATKKLNAKSVEEV